jgi:hypothetical protein
MAGVLAAAGVGLMIALIAAGAWRSGGQADDRAGLLVLGALGIPALAVLAVAGAGTGATPALVAAVTAAVLALGLARPALRGRRRTAGRPAEVAGEAHPAQPLRRAA